MTLWCRGSNQPATSITFKRARCPHCDTTRRVVNGRFVEHWWSSAPQNTTPK